MPKRIGEALKSVVGEGYGEGEKKKGRADSVLMNPNRQSIFQFLIFHPCCSARKISNELGMSPPTVRWHLDKLMASEYVSSATVSNRKVFYPSVMIQEGEIVPILEAVNRKNVGLTFLTIVDNPGATQAEIAGMRGISSQSAREYISVLEDVGLINTIVDGRHKRYFPSDKLRKMEKRVRKRIRNFRKHLLKKLAEDKLNPSVDLSTRREAEVTIHISKRKVSIRIPEEPFTTTVISLAGGERIS